MDLTDYDRTRYARQLLIKDWGESGQARLKSSTVFIAGAGGLGSAVSIYLAEAGVGTLRICDRDKVELSNLNRQILHTDARTGVAKVDSAAETLSALNPTVAIQPVAGSITASTIASFAGAPDLVIDCLDNFETRYILNEYCCRQGIPLLHGGVWGWSGQVTFIHPPQTPCLKCIFPHPTPRSVIPVVGATAGIIGSIQASEALKYLLGLKPRSMGKMIVFDGEHLATQHLPLQRNPKCRVCGQMTPKK